MAAERIDKRADLKAPVIEPGHTYASVTDKIGAIVLRGKTPIGWFIGFLLAFIVTMLLFTAITYLVIKGIGVWGNNVPVGWAFDITNFVWWIGIGHAGTLISAILLLFRQKWRTSINRFAEAMTLFAVACAAIFPTFHTGRPWLDYWLIPYPNNQGLWPNFRSPLDWDVFAISTYGGTSLLFWYIGLIPDLATLRDRAKRPFFQIIYGVLALGWRGSARHWHRYNRAYLLLAALATPLVVSVHTIVSLDFAVGILPGWHATIFPPYFVAGAIFSGFAMVITLAIPLRKFYGLKDFITMHHLENMGKVILATGSVVFYSYLVEAFMAWFSGNAYEVFSVVNRLFGPYAPYYWALLFCNGVAPQVLWFKRVRTSIPALFILSIIVNIGMWLERFIIIVTSLHRGFIPATWAMYYPTVWDWSTYIGTMGLFLALSFLFIRFLPVISIFEMRELVHETSGHGAGHGDGVVDGAGNGMPHDGATQPPRPVPVPAPALAARRKK